jgi:hypothetical protein
LTLEQSINQIKTSWVNIWHDKTDLTPCAPGGRIPIFVSVINHTFPWQSAKYWPYLTFILLGWYLNCSTCFMKNVLLEQKKIKLGNEQHFVGNKAEIMQYILKMQ